jgi:hypothetical protein
VFFSHPPYNPASIKHPPQLSWALLETTPNRFTVSLPTHPFGLILGYFYTRILINILHNRIKLVLTPVFGLRQRENDVVIRSS